MITFDTYAWVEYLNGTDKGAVVQHYVESDDVIFTPTICLAELKARLMKEKRPEKQLKRAMDRVLKRSLLLPLDSEIALKAAEFKNAGLSLADAVIYASALRNATKLLTGDQHFSDYENVEFLG